MLAEIEIIVAAEGQERAAVAYHMHAVAGIGLDDRAAQAVSASRSCELIARELVEGSHGGRTMTGPPVGRNRKVGDNGAGKRARTFRWHRRRCGRTMGYVLVFLGGGLGAMLRHGVNVATSRWLGIGFPWSTFLINVTGSLVMGLMAGWFALKARCFRKAARLFLTTGILGGYTTFSAFSLDAALLYERGEFGLAAVYVIGSVVLSIGGLFAGLWLVRQFPEQRR